VKNGDVPLLHAENARATTPQAVNPIKRMMSSPRVLIVVAESTETSTIHALR
jgi:hypothetical protein